MKKGRLLRTLALAALLTTILGGTALADRAPDPRFAAPKIYDNPGGRDGLPYSVVKGDFDEDDVLDLAMSVGDAPENALSLFKGRRDGTFAEPPTQFDVAQNASDVVRSDFDDDGHLDLAVADLGDQPESPGSVTVLYGTGNGTFRDRMRLPSGGIQPQHLATPDVDGDGNEDVAVSNINTVENGSFKAGNVTILTNTGRRAFRTGQSIRMGSGPFAVAQGLAVGDLDGDGDPDLLVTNPARDKVVSMRNRGGRYTLIGASRVGTDPRQVVVGLFNGGRRLDFATANSASSNVSVGLGRGDGTFRSVRNWSTGGDGAAGLISRDLNGDNKHDLAVSNTGFGVGTGNDNLGVLTGRGDGTFRKPETFRAGSGPAGLTAGRFDRDKKPDLAVPNQYSNKLSILLNKTRR